MTAADKSRSFGANRCYTEGEALKSQRSFTARVGAGLLSALIATSVVSAPLSAQAQTPQELAKARTQYKQGLSLEAAGDWGGALAKFEAVAKVKTTPQVRFHIARCKENLGRLNEALGEYRLAEYEAQQAGAKELEEISKAREGLEARIPKLIITRGEGTASARIELDGVELGEAKVGQEVSVDPGPHRILVKVPQGQFEENVNLTEGETKNVELVIPEHLEKKPPPSSGGESLPGEPPPDTVTVDAAGPGALPWIIGGVGIVGLAAGGYFALQRNKADSDLDKVCRADGVCPRSSQSLQDDGERYAMLTNVGLGVGIVGIGVATVMLLSSGGSEEESVAKNKLRVDVVPSGAFTGVNISGHF